MHTKELIEAASGRKKAALVLKGGSVVNVFSGLIEKADVAIEEGIIVGVGDYSGIEEIDITGKYVMPSFIDAHMHIESTQLTPASLAKLIVPHGTTSLIADPHEIANVAGLAGIEYMIRESETLPIDVHFMLPSCVPATPFEDAGAVLDGAVIEKALPSKNYLGLGEFMNYPGVIAADDDVVKKLEAALHEQKIIDGHACNVTGADLNAYLVTGIKTDHECTTREEMREKLARGMYIQVREGSSTRNLIDLLPEINAFNLRRCLMCTDDKRIRDLIGKGHIDHNIRTAIRAGLDAVSAITMATLNTAECYGLKNLGAVAPSYRADLAVADNLQDFNILMVFKDGKQIAKDGKPLFEAKPAPTTEVLSSVKIKPLEKNDLKIRVESGRAVVLSLLPRNVVTKKEVRTVGLTDGIVDLVKNKGLNKLAVVERHRASGKIGLGLIEGYGIQNGAIAITVAHDSHNLIAVGDNDDDMLLAIRHLSEMGGGMVIVSAGEILQTLVLDVAGLMSSADVSDVYTISEEMEQLAFSLGVNAELEPFMCLSFLSLAVIPEIKITARGLFDVNTFSFVDIDAEK